MGGKSQGCGFGGESLSIEQSGRTEEMRHIPKVEVLLRRLEPSLRAAGEVLATSLATGNSEASSSAHRHLDRAIHWLESVDLILRPRQHSASKDPDLRKRFAASIDHAAQALNAVDRNGFRRRSPFHAFERSKGECVVAAIAAAELELELAAEALGVLVTDVHHRIAAAKTPMVPFFVIDEKYRTRL